MGRDQENKRKRKQASVSCKKIDSFFNKVEIGEQPQEIPPNEAPKLEDPPVPEDWEGPLFNKSLPNLIQVNYMMYSKQFLRDRNINLSFMILF